MYFLASMNEFFEVSEMVFKNTPSTALEERLPSLQPDEAFESARDDDC